LLDLAYLMLAIVVLASGSARLLWFGKEAAFYLHNPVFWIKLSLFVAIALISIPPTRCFLRWRRARKITYPTRKKRSTPAGLCSRNCCCSCSFR
jgi:putative membrane protein